MPRDAASSHATPDAGLRERLLCGCPLVFRGWAGTDARVPPLSGRIDCGPGWDTLIEVLFEALEEGAQRRVQEGLSPLRAPAPLEIKEHHGQLRVHLYRAAPWTDRWVELAVRRSRRLCVDCGAEAEMLPDGRVVEAPRCRLHARCDGPTRPLRRMGHRLFAAKPSSGPRQGLGA